MALSVYRISLIRNRYQEIVICDQDRFLRRFPRPFSGFRMNPSDEPIICTVDDANKPAADLSYLRPGTMVVSESVLKDEIDSSTWGELIPLSVDGRRAYAVNCIHMQDWLDEDASSFGAASADIGPRLSRYVFHGHRFSEPSVFKIELTANYELLCYGGGNDDPIDEFPAYLQESGRTGVRLELLWSESQSQ